jgi:hypothetical protein
MTVKLISPLLSTATICGAEVGAALDGMKSKDAICLVNILAEKRVRMKIFIQEEDSYSV